MEYRMWLESTEELQKRTITMNGTFYHVTPKQNVQQILQSGFSLADVGKGFGYVDLGEPNGISLFVHQNDVSGFKSNKGVLAVQVANAKTLDARNIEQGYWVQHDGGWPEFFGYIFDIEGEEAFDRDFVTKVLLKSGFAAVLHSAELRILDLKVIKSVTPVN